MRAVVLDRFGDPADVLRVADVPVPEPGPGEVRVRMLAAPVNPSDLMMVRGIYSIRPALPATPGLEGVGEVDAIGSGLLPRWLRGKRVCVLGSRTGSWAEWAVVPARQAVPVPRDLPVEQAAMSFVNPVTAHVLTRRVLRVPRGAWLLQTAAASALGRMVVRLGKLHGFRTVSVVRRAEQAEELRGLGGDAVVVADAETLTAEVQRVVPGGVLYAIDPVGGATGSAVVRCLAPGGRLVVFGTLSGEPLVFSSRDLMTTGTSVEGFWLGHWMRRVSLLERALAVRTAQRLLREGVLAPEVGTSVPMARVTEAMHAAEQPARRGKVLLTF